MRRKRMNKTILKIIEKAETLYHREMIVYLLVGGLTTLINIIIYQSMTTYFRMDTLVANLIAWIVAVLFAFVTNDQIVFHKQSYQKNWFGRFWQFIVCRGASLIVDDGGMFLLVECLLFPGLASKIIMNIIVILINYVLSKKLIFR